VTPRAGRSVISGVREGLLLVRLAAPPVEGAANQALIALLAESFDVPKRSIRLVSGERSRTKRVEIGGVAPEVLEERLRGILSE
jgi:uncharacterized protein (TIGR00251 family)